MIGAAIAFAHTRNTSPIANPSKALTAKATKTMIMIYSHSHSTASLVAQSVVGP
jgi:hypothetical protein